MNKISSPLAASIPVLLLCAVSLPAFAAEAVRTRGPEILTLYPDGSRFLLLPDSRSRISDDIWRMEYLIDFSTVDKPGFPIREVRGHIEVNCRTIEARTVDSHADDGKGEPQSVPDDAAISAWDRLDPSEDDRKIYRWICDMEMPDPN